MIQIVTFNNTTINVNTFDEIFSFKINEIIDIDFSYNNLTEFPNDLLKLYNLKYIKMSYNKIKTIPNELCNLKNLESIDISFNEIDLLPIQLLQLKKLKVIFCYNTNIKEIPKDFILSHIKIKTKKYPKIYSSSQNPIKITLLNI